MADDYEILGPLDTRGLIGSSLEVLADLKDEILKRLAKKPDGNRTHQLQEIYGFIAALESRIVGL